MRSNDSRGHHGPGRSKRRVVFLIAASAVVALSAAACSPTTAKPDGGLEFPSTDEISAEAAARMTDLYEDALAEGGKVVIYDTQVDTATREKVLAAFESRFPGIDAESMPNVSILEQFLTEKRAGLSNVDVFENPGLEPFLFGDAIDYVEPYTPADATYYTTENTFIEGIAYPAFAYDSGMAIYNPTLLTESEVDLLSSFEGWADPAFAGRASIEGPFAGAQYRPLFYQLNQDPSLGEDWFQSVSELNPTVFDSVQPQSAAIIAGDLAVGFNAPLHIIPRTVAAAGDDVPLKLAAAEYAIATPVVSVLVKDSPHPAAAKLWLEWILTQEAQSTITTVAKLVGLRDGFVPPESEKWWVELLPEVRAADEALIAKDRDALPELFLDKFGGLQG